jgi:hypothetical protein
MQELLQQIDPDYYRSARLLLVHTEIEELRQVRLAITDSQETEQYPLRPHHPADKPVQPQYHGG